MLERSRIMVDQSSSSLSGARETSDEPARLGRARDFVDRYERGAYDELDDQEVVQTYQAATTQLSPEEFQRAAAEAFRRMSPQERQELLQEMRRRAPERVDAADDSPEELARTVQRAEQDDQGGGGLAGLFGFGGAGGDDRQAQGGGLPGMFDNPLVKIGIAGIAAMAAKFLTDPDRQEGQHHGGQHH
jgi:hypothetical protein